MEITHKLCEDDIKNYKEEINLLQAELKEGEKTIKELKEENEKLKNNQQNKNNDQSNKRRPSIKNALELSHFLGFQQNKININQKEQDNRNISQKNNLPVKNELFLQKKSAIQKQLNEIKEKSNTFNETIEGIDKLTNDNRKCVKELNQNMNNLIQNINLSMMNRNNANNNDQIKKRDEIYQQIEKISFSLNNLDDIISNIKNTFRENIDNVIDIIYFQLNELEQNKDEYNFNNITQMINSEFKEIENILDNCWTEIDNFYEKNQIMEKEMDKLKNLYKKFEEEKNKREKIRKDNIKKELNNKQNNNQINNRNRNNNYVNKNKNNLINNGKAKQKNDLLGESFLMKIKDRESKLELFKSKNVFQQNNENNAIEEYIQEAQLIKKNFRKICYIYDDYDIYDIFYDLKAIGLKNGEYYNKGFQSFAHDRIIVIQKFEINGKSQPYTQKKNLLEYKMNLNNLGTLKMHVVYKSSKNKNFFTKDELNQRKLYKKEYYGLDKSLSGQKAKISLILKGNYDIVNFSEYFLIRNKNNKNEIEYMWGGTVPYGGLETIVMLSKREAMWNFHNPVKLSSNYNIRDTTLKVLAEFLGGNIEIIDIKATSPQSDNCSLDEQGRRYIVHFSNTQSKQIAFNIEGIFKNKCKGEWEVDLTDEEIENLMPEEDRLCKEQLKIIAKNIINDFDKKNKNNDFEFHDYMKIGLWVYKNIKYDINYKGKTQYSAIDIYNMKKGVCHHFTKLSNALLYSLGYQVLYVRGYAIKNSINFKMNDYHAWSLIKINNKWYPFDSTWGILTGKLPVGHVFSGFFNGLINYQGTDTVNFKGYEINGTFME